MLVPLAKTWRSLARRRESLKDFFAGNVWILCTDDSRISLFSICACCIVCSSSAWLTLLEITKPKLSSTVWLIGDIFVFEITPVTEPLDSRRLKETPSAVSVVAYFLPFSSFPKLTASILYSLPFSSNLQITFLSLGWVQS